MATKNNISTEVVLAKNEPDRQLILNGPGDRTLLTGVTIQQTAKDISDMAVANYIAAIDATLKVALGDLAKVRAVQAEANEAYRLVAETVTAPEGFKTDLEELLKTYSKFSPKCTCSSFKVKKKKKRATEDEDDDDDDTNERDDRAVAINLSAAVKKCTVTGSIWDKTGRAVINVSRTFDFPKELVAAHEVVLQADAGVNKVNARIEELRSLKAQAPQAGHETMAQITRHNLLQSGAGDLVASIDRGVLGRIKKEGLVVPDGELKQLAAAQS